MAINLKGKVTIGRYTIVQNGLVLHLDAGNSLSYPGYGTNWNDLSGNSNHATLTNGPTYSASNLGSVVFDGVDDYAYGNTPVSGNTNYTMTGFVKVNLNTKGAFFKSASGGGGCAIGMGSGTFDSNRNSVIMLFPDVRWIGTGSTWNSGWQMVTMVLNSSGVPSAYINNEFIAESSGSLSNNAYGEYYVARSVGNELVGSTRAANCQIGNFMMYNRALSASEITQNYNALKSRYGL